MADQEHTPADVARLQALLTHLADVHAEEYMDADTIRACGVVIMLFAHDGVDGVAMGGAFVARPHAEMPRMLRRALQVLEKTAAELVRGTVQLPPTGKLDS